MNLFPPAPVFTHFSLLKPPAPCDHPPSPNSPMTLLSKAGSKGESETRASLVNLNTAPASSCLVLAMKSFCEDAKLGVLDTIRFEGDVERRNEVDVSL